MFIPKKIKTTDIIQKFKASGARGRPFMVFFLPFCCLFFYSHHISEYFYNYVDYSPYQYNQHAHTHFSGMSISQ